jgi:hypothetical protein
MEKELIEKINNAINESFVGNYIFTKEELAEIYDVIGIQFRKLIYEKGESLSLIYYYPAFIALVNLAKEWCPGENSFFDFVYNKFDIPSDKTSKIYLQIVDIINNLYKNKRIFCLDSFTKKYYATICSHAFAPTTSTFAFFDLCWEIYCDDLNEEYVKNDPSFEMISESLNKKFNLISNDDDDFKIGSKSYSLRCGIKGLPINEKNKFIQLIDDTICKINHLYNYEPIELNNYYSILIKNWWDSKVETFGVYRIKNINNRSQIFTNYSEIRPQYILENDHKVKILISSIRLKENFNISPHIELKLNNEIIVNENLNLKGSGVLMATQEYSIDVTNYNSLNISLQIIQNGNEIYSSKDYLKRDIVLFNPNGKEIISQICLPSIYFAFIPNMNLLLEYPKNMQKTSMYNIFSIYANENDILQTKNKTIFFQTENKNNSIYFYANQIDTAIFRLNDQDYKIINGELYLQVLNNFDIKDLGVKYNNTIFKLSEFTPLKSNDEIRYCLSSLLNVGEPQKINIFKYSNNTILCSINLIKFNNITINYDKDMYYGENEKGIVKFKTEKYLIEKDFTINDDELFINFNNGYIILYPPILKWKIDNGKWNHSELNLWYEEIKNTSILFIGSPKNKLISISIENAPNNISQGKNFNEFLIGNIVSYMKGTSPLKCIKFIINVDNSINFSLFSVYIKESFFSIPFEVNYYQNELMWNPNLFIGNADSKFRLKIESKDRKMYTYDLDTKSQSISLKDFQDGYYMVYISLIKNIFINEEVSMIGNQIIIGDERKFRYKDKKLFIASACTNDNLVEERIEHFFIENIKYLGLKDNTDFYSGTLYIKDDYGKNIYQNFKTNNLGIHTRINPIRIVFRDKYSCYIGYGLDITDNENFEYDNEFSISDNGKIMIDIKTNGIKNKYVRYFKFKEI